MGQYKLIKKWLGLEVGNRMTLAGKIASDHISADELEAKLAEGFEVYESGDGSISRDEYKVDKFMSLAIGKQPIKKKTKEQAALEFVQKLSEDALVLPNKMILEKAKEILEMK